MKLHNRLLKQISPSLEDSRPVELFQERERTATVLLLDLRAGMSRMWRSKAEANFVGKWTQIRAGESYGMSAHGYLI